MNSRLLTLAALILGLASGCGGSENSPPDPASGSGGNEAVGGSDGAGGGSPDELPAVKGDDGQWHCTEAGMALSTEKKEPPVCTTQANTIDEPDAATSPPDSAEEPPADMGTPPEPDAAVCRDWSEQLCSDQPDGGADCILVPTRHPMPGPCPLWDCVDPNHRDRAFFGGLSGDYVPESCPNLAE